MLNFFRNKRHLINVSAFLLLLILVFSIQAQENPASSTGTQLYNQIKQFSLNGGMAEVSGLVLKRDRVQMTFNGTFYFTSEVEGKVTGAVFIGQGTFQAETIPSDFEKSNIKRLLGSETIESDFKTAVLKFTDDTFNVIGKSKREGNVNPQAQKLASEINDQILKETGANISARLTQSILNDEEQGIFFATFDGGKLKRFSYLLDPKCFIPTAYFGINGGEKGVIFSYISSVKFNEAWTAFYSLSDYAEGTVDYSDVHDLVDILNYDLNLDLADPKKKLGLKAKVSMKTLQKNIRAIPFVVGESLSEWENSRLKNQLRVKSVKLGTDTLEVIQEDWDGGVTVFFPKAMAENQNIELEFELEGNFMQQPNNINHSHYPISTTSWYPRHGYLDRATYNFTATHPKNMKAAIVGNRMSEEVSPDDKNLVVTKYSMPHPVALVTFALAPFERHTETIKWEKGGKPIPLEFNSMPGAYLAIKEDFILAELSNSVRYFHQVFGDYPYEKYGATFHPYGFGQGFPSMLMIPNTDRSSKYTYAFVAHETAHQWWGNIVAWRSYRDQWLSEGFAEYSGVLYTSLRDSPKSAKSLIDDMRRNLKDPPRTTTGVGKGRLTDVGPLILGHRLNTSKTLGTYQTLIYEKGGLVLRMLHYLFTDPNTGNGEAFYTMMKDFVEKYRNDVASTDDFREVANAHFVNTPIAKRYDLKDLNWFFLQWVYSAELPSYKLEYKIENQPDGKFLLSGNVIQEGAGENWFMPLPLTLTVGNNQVANGTVAAYGPKMPFKIMLPFKPVKVELDPNNWILSEKTTTGK